MLVDNKNWGSFIITMLTGIGVIALGIFSMQLDNAARNCAIEKDNAAVIQSAAMAAVGGGVSIVLFSASDKFKLFSTPTGRTMFLVLIGSALIVMGSFGAMVLKSKDVADCGAALINTTGFLLGLGGGIFIPMIVKFFISLSKQRDSGDGLSGTKAGQIIGSTTTALIAIFSGIVGSFSWHAYNSCKSPSTDEKTALTANGALTIVSFILAVYCIVFVILRGLNLSFGFKLANWNNAGQ